jgi:type II secretory pathway component PulF
MFINMAIYLTKRLFVFINVVALVIFLPRIAIAAPVQLNVTSSVIVAQGTHTATDSFSDNNLTPQQSQQLQAVRQRRNREINAVLNISQRTKLSNKLRAGKNINKALETLNLQPEQQELVEAILKFTNLKMKAISSRYSLTIR